MDRKSRGHDLDYEKVKKEVVELLSRRKSALFFFWYLADRGRTSKITDLNQLVSFTNRRPNATYALDRETVLDVFKALTKCGIGIARDEKSRTKLHWTYWVIPIFDRSNRNILRGLEINPISEFLDHRNQLKAIKDKVEKYSLNLSNPNPDPNLKPRVVFDDLNVVFGDPSIEDKREHRDGGLTSTKLTKEQHSVLRLVDEKALIGELEHRHPGWTISLTQK